MSSLMTEENNWDMALTAADMFYLYQVFTKVTFIGPIERDVHKWTKLSH